MKFYQNKVGLIMFLGRWGEKLLKERLNLFDGLGWWGPTKRWDQVYMSELVLKGKRHTINF